MKTFRVSLTVHFSASDDIEVEAVDEADARRKAEYEHEISALDADEEYVDIDSVELVDDGEDEEGEPPSSELSVTRDQMILPGTEEHLRRFRWAS